MPDNRPGARQKNVGTGSAEVSRRGSGLGTGPVGSGSAFSGGGGSNRSGGGRSKLTLIVILAVLLLGGGGGLGSLLGGGGSSAPAETAQTQDGGAAGDVQSLGGYGGMYSTGSGDGGTEPDRTVSPEAREKYTTIKGDGSDQITMMVYMCGTDLESKAGMATNDLTEMTKADISDKLNIIVLTGGCKSWKNSIISSRNNQIYQIKDGGLKLLKDNAGNKAMTDPENLTDFIGFCTENYPANRNMLIFWDHGGGSLSGYGYDEKNPNAGSMTLAQIDSALKKADTKFDFIGFDACLMATLETDLMAADYADYLIASEETEPGVGWYYTNWLTALSKDPGMSTVDIGKNIVDDFVSVCARSTPNQKTTLSVVDLAELSRTVPDEFKSWASSVTEQIKNNDYKVVSDARQGAREFARSSKIDQIDLIHFTENLETQEGKALAETLRKAVKYNRTSVNIDHANGVSIYFPYQKKGAVDRAVQINDAVGVDSEYSSCIKEFSALQASGQAASGGQTSPLSSLLGSAGSSYAGGSSSSLAGMLQIMQAISQAANTDFSGRALGEEETAQYIEGHQFDPSNLTWKKNSAGEDCIILPEEQWSLVHSVDMNLFVDDGEGFIDLGLDNLFSYDEDNNLIPDKDGTWLTIDGKAVAYYHLDTSEDNTIVTGYVPALLNGERVKLMLTFENGVGRVEGADPDYGEEVTGTVARGLMDLQDGDELQFLCDHYSYEGEYRDSYYLGDPVTVSGEPEVKDLKLDVGKTLVLYRFTDIFDQKYWSDPLQ